MPLSATRTAEIIYNSDIAPGTVLKPPQNPMLAGQMEPPAGVGSA